MDTPRAGRPPRTTSPGFFAVRVFGRLPFLSTRLKSASTAPRNAGGANVVGGSEPGAGAGGRAVFGRVTDDGRGDRGCWTHRADAGVRTAAGRCRGGRARSTAGTHGAL